MSANIAGKKAVSSTKQYWNGLSPALRPFLGRVQIRNYKSIGACDLHLKNLSILVGRNGSGKSNFLDALRFVSEGLQTSLDHAVKSRGGIDSVRRKSTGHPRNFALQLELNLKEGAFGIYSFEIGAGPKGGFIVKNEQLRTPSGGFRIQEGKVRGSLKREGDRWLISQEENLPAASSDRFYLVSASGMPQYRPYYDALANMGFYNLNPEVMKIPQSPDAGELLHRDGGNIASVIARLSQEKPELKVRIENYLHTIVPGISSVDRLAVGAWETLEFRQSVEGSKHPWRFHASSISDGTLRALGALVAVTQLAERDKPVSLVGIEEPETALHPAAAGAMMDALREAASHTQVIVTTHSPDLLDAIQFNEEQVLAVLSREGKTEIGPLDPASVETIQSHLYSQVIYCGWINWK